MSHKVLLLFSFCLILNAQTPKRIFNLAPLPTKKLEQNIKEFLPIHSYMQKKMGIKINYVHLKNYRDILDGFKNGSIDIAYLGPLPFIELYKEYKYAKPIVIFKQRNGLAKYRCVLAKFKDDNIDFSKKIKVALTQPLSTCGYFMSSKLLKEKFSVNLKDKYYDYTMSHTNALSAVLKGEFDIAGAKESIAQRFESLGLEIIAKSEPLPGFSIVVNTKTVSKEEIELLQKILDFPIDKLKQIGGIISKGVVKTNIRDYDMLKVNFKIPTSGNMK